MSSVLHGQAKDRRHGRSRREVPPAVRVEDGNALRLTLALVLKTRKEAASAAFFVAAPGVSRHSVAMRSAGTRLVDAQSAALAPPDPYRVWKQLGLLLLAFAWIALGLTGHDPWKFDDATTFGIAWEDRKSVV